MIDHSVCVADTDDGDYDERRYSVAALRLVLRSDKLYFDPRFLSAVHFIRTELTNEKLSGRSFRASTCHSWASCCFQIAKNFSNLWRCKSGVGKLFCVACPQDS